MKLFACTLPLLAGIPSVMSAQVSLVSLVLPKIQRPAVKATLGPIALVATLSGHGVTVRTAPSSPGRAPGARVPRRTSGGSASAARVLTTAENYLGNKYVYGGETPAVGFDCSGFVQYVFGRHGVDLPRTSRLQATAGRAVGAGVSGLRPGDLMLFSSEGRGIDHVAIYAGNNRMLHSSAGAGGVTYEDLSTSRGKWYVARLVASRRVL
jgi:cell wall-associated NlpC family hydrolase